MTDHLPECGLFEPCYDGNPHDMNYSGWDRCYACEVGCICDRLRACEKRVLEAAIAAVREAIGEEWRGDIVPKGEYDCCGCSSYNGIVNDATAAIDALRLAKP